MKVTKSLGPQGSIYAAWMANSKHNVVTNPAMVKQILIDRNTPITMNNFIHHVMDNVWDAQGTIRSIPEDHLWGDIHAVLAGMMRESFVAKAIPMTVGMVQDRIFNLISGADSPVDQAIWEREGKVDVASSNNADNFVAEADLFPLLRYFVADIATPALMGRDFLSNFPEATRDLFMHDTKFNLFMAGAPSWLPNMAGPAAARTRLLQAVEEHHEALFKYMDGKDPGPRWKDMSDVSSIIADRAKEFRRAGGAPRSWITGNGTILWAMNVNANTVIFWLIFYIYSDPTLLEEIRQEVAPYVKITPSKDNGLPIKEPPKVDIDIVGLWSNCPLLKGAFMEAMRLEATSMSMKMVESDFLLHDESSSIDTKSAGGKVGSGKSWLLKKGEFICVPHGVHQADANYFADPEKFDARRFWSHAPPSEKSESNANGITGSTDTAEEEVRVEYKTMRVWGGGKQMCKGKTFAEREVVLFVAAIVMMWEIEPIDRKEGWKHPGRLVGAGANVPKREFRVRMRRREV
jgi:hypothetical protein